MEHTPPSRKLTGWKYPNSTWPVWTTFNYRYAQMHGPHEPAWEFYKDQMDYIACNNFAMQSGKTKRDLAIWQFITGYPYHIRSRTYEPFDLENAGEGVSIAKSAEWLTHNRLYL